MEEKIETYDVLVWCANCGRGGTVSIPKGVSVKDFQCPFCGCEGLQRSFH